MSDTNKPAWTPGPWRVGQDGNSSRSVIAENGQSIAAVWRHETGNAALIAAAPDLYEALKTIRQTLTDDAHVLFVDAALAKAEGRS